ncbi:SMI1/KNR4 family protein [Stenotrophomonas sp. PD6]|uniref:SMI1/KNR4 family protein n=1 Tax=Stenotrophomonas sp. PD6 TaxID=3368612 RepID=UPI003BA2A8F8
MRDESVGEVFPPRVEELVALHGELVSFGRESDAVGEGWLAKAESRLGLVFSPSYRWFLNKYKGGEICGEEIFSVYGIDFDEVSGGDVVHQHLLDLERGLTNDHSLVVSRTDLGEVFFFDYDGCVGSEVPVRLLLPSGENVAYASDFFEFLVKRIASYL